MKKSRIIVDVPPDLKEWVEAQAAAEFLKSGDWVRREIAFKRAGNSLPHLRLPPAPQLHEILPPVIQEAIEDQNQAAVDTDAILANALAAAEEAGLTQPAEQLNEPQPTVRPLRRPSSKYSPGNQSHINKYLS